MTSRFTAASVLVVDDDTFVLRTTAAALSRLGYLHVLTAAGGAEALDVMMRADPPVGLVLTDINMPDIDGVELLRQLAERGYRGGLVLFSGEDSQTLEMTEALARARRLRVIGEVSKPLKPQLLADLLAREPSASLSRVPRASELVSPEALDEAIECGEVIPWFQPKVQVKTRKVIGVEALARWPEAEGGPIFPDAFIPVAEEHGLIDKLTFSLVAQSVQADAAWREHGLDLNIAVNVSMNSLQNLGFPDQLMSVLAEAGGTPERFQIEVTESRLADDLTRALDVLLRLRLKRIRLSIDDFGTGHSNLGQLRDLPFDEMKLDRSYLQAAARHARSRTILEGTILLARELGLEVVSEGVETAGDWERVRQLGCDLAQGYFIGRPMPASAIPAWVTAWDEQGREMKSGDP